LGGEMMKVKNVQSIICLVILFLFANHVWAADWKYFGGTVLPKSETVIAYYDAESIEYLSNGNIRVWTKAVNPSEVTKILEKKEVIKKSAQKLAQGYFPPYVLLNPYPKTSYNSNIDIIAWEEAANHYEIKPKARILFEINCNEKMIRTLSTILYKNDGGVTNGSNDPDKWSYISPETNAETIKNIVCSAGKTSKTKGK